MSERLPRKLKKQLKALWVMRWRNIGADLVFRYAVALEIETQLPSGLRRTLRFRPRNFKPDRLGWIRAGELRGGS